MRFAAVGAPGGRGAGRWATRFDWVIGGGPVVKLLAVGMLRGIGGGARGFSKLVSWFEGKRGLVGGLVMVERCE